MQKIYLTVKHIYDSTIYCICMTLSAAAVLVHLMAVSLGHFPHCCLVFPAHFSSPALLPWRGMLSAVPQQSDREGMGLSISLPVCSLSDWLGPRSTPMRMQSSTPARGIIRYVTPLPCFCTSLRVLIMKCHSVLFFCNHIYFFVFCRLAAMCFCALFVCCHKERGFRC